MRGAGGRHFERLGRADLASRLRGAQHRAAAPHRPRALPPPRAAGPAAPSLSLASPPRPAPRRTVYDACNLTGRSTL
ncbi:unnamed protein product [Parnassius apollo]|uniref:(apollo) hypothetical protein n=1 Tax=Parnassius apollo TaxID=110799 RepID=A0A8S3X4L1_PARAO|nr:unnamed protein product [Parnassius apollo]